MLNKFFKKQKNSYYWTHWLQGSWLTMILSSYGAKIYGYAQNPISKPNFFDNLKLTKYLEKDFRENICNKVKLDNFIKKYKPEIIFHLAAQSSVLVSYKTKRNNKYKCNRYHKLT